MVQLVNRTTRIGVLALAAALAVVAVVHAEVPSRDTAAKGRQPVLQQMTGTATTTLETPGTPETTVPEPSPTTEPSPSPSPAAPSAVPGAPPIYLPVATIGNADDDFLARLLAGGARDPGYRLRVRPAGAVTTMVVLPNGDVIVAGNFNTVSGENRSIVRLKDNGTIDHLFRANVEGNIQAVLNQDDGRLLVGGEYEWVNLAPRRNLARLNKDGSLDRSFSSSSEPDGPVTSLAEPYGTGVLVAGAFSHVGSVAVPGAAKLWNDGSQDQTFQPQIELDRAAGDHVRLITADWHARVLVGGQLSVNGVGRVPTARLLADGALDPDYDASELEGTVSSWVRQPDGKVLLGGSLGRRGEPDVYNVYRVTTEGRIDPTFSPYRLTDSNRVTASLYALEVMLDDRVFVGGAVKQHGATEGYVLAQLDSRGVERRRYQNLFDSPGGVKRILALARHDAGRILVGGASLDP